MATKARWLLGQLQVLGFPDWQCAVAVLRHGSNLHDGVAFLLEDHVTSEEQSRAYMASAVDSPDIDISEELQMLAEAQVRPHTHAACTLFFSIWIDPRAEHGSTHRPKQQVRYSNGHIGFCPYQPDPWQRTSAILHIYSEMKAAIIV